MTACHKLSCFLCLPSQCCRYISKKYTLSSSSLRLRLPTSEYATQYSFFRVRSVSWWLLPAAIRSIIKCRLSFMSVHNSPRPLVNCAISADTLQTSIFYCAMLCIRAVYAVMQCPSVCQSRSWVASKRIDIFEIFSPSGSLVYAEWLSQWGRFDCRFLPRNAYA